MVYFRDVTIRFQTDTITILWSKHLLRILIPILLPHTKNAMDWKTGFIFVPLTTNDGELNKYKK